jgi:hypothetical protein
MVPLVRDSDRRPHPRWLWKALVDALFDEFGGYTGPEGPIPGGYTNRSGRRVTDESFRYTVSLPSRRVADLRQLLTRVANSFDQECIYLVVGVEAELVDADAASGDLGEG